MKFTDILIDPENQEISLVRLSQKSIKDVRCFLSSRDDGSPFIEVSSIEFEDGSIVELVGSDYSGVVIDESTTGEGYFSFPDGLLESLLRDADT